jgi:hypothetical protein
LLKQFGRRSKLVVGVVRVVLHLERENGQQARGEADLKFSGRGARLSVGQ